MKMLTIVAAVVFLVGATHSALSSETAGGMDHSGRLGKMIHETTVDGYRLAYHLLELDKGAGLHLMVYITGPEGQKIEEAKVGFLLKGPDGATQKLMAEGMKGAFGANVDFKAVGAYVIKMKAVIGEKKLMDAFAYEVK